MKLRFTFEEGCMYKLNFDLKLAQKLRLQNKASLAFGPWEIDPNFSFDQCASKGTV